MSIVNSNGQIVKPDSPETKPARWATTIGDQQVYEICCAGVYGVRFKSLYQGETALAKGDDERDRWVQASFEVVRSLSYRIGFNEVQIDRVFRKSALYKQHPGEWDDPFDEDDANSLSLGQMMIQQALGLLPDDHRPPAKTNVDDNRYADFSASDFAVNVGDVKATQIEWLWEDRLMVNVLNMFAGPGGDGKTTLALTIAASVSTGNCLPDGSSPGDPGSVLVLSAEDDASDTLTPRFVAAGGEPWRKNLWFLKPDVIVKDPETGEKVVHPISLKDSLYWIQQFKLFRPRLLIIDPVPAYLGKGVNDKSNSAVLSLLRGFGTIAKEFKVCVILITHTGKSTDRKLIHKILDSVAYSNACRVVHVTVRDPENRDDIYLELAKGNNSGKIGALKYELIPTNISYQGQGFKTSKVILDPVPVTIDAEEMSNHKPGPKPSTRLAEWLYDFLVEHPGPMLQSRIVEAAGAQGLIGDFNPETKKWSALSGLYRAEEQIPGLAAPRAGKRIQRSKLQVKQRGRKPVQWELVAQVQTEPLDFKATLDPEGPPTHSP